MATTMWVIGLGIAAAAAGVCLWALLADRARGRSRCPRCWYDLAGATPPAICPECGRRITTHRQLRRTRRRWRIAVAAAAVGIAAGWLAPALATGRWVSAVPAPALDLAIDMWFEDDARQRLRRAWRGAELTSWNRALISWATARELREAHDDICEHQVRSARWAVGDCGDPHGWIADEIVRTATLRETSAARVAALKLFPVSRTAALRRYAARAEVTGHEAVLLARQVVTPGRGAYVTDHEGRLAWMRGALLHHRLSPSVRAAVLEHMTRYTEPHLLIIEEWLRQERSADARAEGLRILGDSAMAAQPNATRRILRRLGDHRDPAIRTEAARLLGDR